MPGWRKPEPGHPKVSQPVKAWFGCSLQCFVEAARAVCFCALLVAETASLARANI